MRKSTAAMIVLAGGLVLLLLEVVHGVWRNGADAPARGERAELVRALGLSDLALFTEARYTRHPTQADLFTPFQDAPLSLEHFPTGSLTAPPRDFGPSGRFATEQEK